MLDLDLTLGQQIVYDIVEDWQPISWPDFLIEAWYDGGPWRLDRVRAHEMVTDLMNMRLIEATTKGLVLVR